MNSSLFKILTLALVVSLAQGNLEFSKCKFGEVFDCVQKADFIQGFKGLIGKPIDEILHHWSSLDACKMKESMMNCAMKFDITCVEGVPESVQDAMLDLMGNEEVMKMVMATDRCEAINKVLHGVDSMYECHQSLMKLDQYKDEEKLVEFVQNKVMGLHEPLCCAMKKSSRYDESLAGECDDMSKNVMKWMDSRMVEFMEAVCSSVEADSEVCKAHLSEN